MPSSWPQPSSDTVEISFLDGPRAIEELRKLAQDLVAQDPWVVEVLLFGSLATGNYAPGSDADLIIVLSEVQGRPLERADPYLKWFLAAPVPVDIFVYTWQELERRAAEGNPFIKRALGEAVRLAIKGAGAEAAHLPPEGQGDNERQGAQG